jgi:hypothetical protein
MRLRARSLAAIAMSVVLGCSRDLTLPTPNPLGVSPAVASVAPRERLQLSGSGGVQPYRFAFAAGGKVSGAEATVDAATGLYRAGALGPAQDVVEVTDASGHLAEARLTVGSPIQASPFVVATSPGGATTLRATGGKPPYAFELSGAQAGSSLQVSAGGLEAVYQAGPLGDRQESVVVTDATRDPADPAPAQALVEVRIGAGVRIYANTQGTVAPHQAVEFIAVGGQPPYVFGLANAGAAEASGGSISATGAYQAGGVGAADGSVHDDVTATDAFGQVSAPFRLQVSAPLQLSIASVDLSPGKVAALVATGGMPPYRYAFQARGNRTHGSVDSVTGAYTPGSNQGASDLLEVTDATRGGRATLAAQPVGYSEVEVGPWTGRIIAARLRGDTRADSGQPRHDLAYFRWEVVPGGYVFNGISNLYLPAGLDPVVSTGWLAQASGQPFAVDADGDGHDELVVFGYSSPTVAVLDPDMMGGLSLAGTAALVSASPGVARSPLAATHFYTGTTCNDGQPGLAGWEVGASLSLTSTCHHGSATGFIGPTVSADLDGDGLPDLAFLTTGGAGAVTVLYGNASGGFDAGVPTALPGTGCTQAGFTYWTLPGRLAAMASSDPADGTTYLIAPATCKVNGVATNVVFRLDARVRGAPIWNPPGPIDLLREAGPSFLMAPFAPAIGMRPLLAHWGGIASTLGALSVDAGGTVTRLDPLPRPFPNSFMSAAFPDLNGDGVADLAVHGGSYARFYYGDGDGRFGFRARFGELSSIGVADVDGDGLDDLVANVAGTGLATLFGGDHQLAWGPTTLFDLGVSNHTAGDFGAGYPEAVFRDAAGDFNRVRVAADGSFGPLQAISTTYYVPPSATSGVALANRFNRAELGLSAGADIWTVWGSSAIVMLVFDAPASLRFIVSDPVFGTCAFLPIGVGDTTAPADPVALCLSGSDLVLQRAVYSSGTGRWGTWGEVARFAGAAGSTARVVAAGRDQAGRGVFVGVPSGPSPQPVNAYLVEPGASRAAAFTVRTIPLGGLPGTPSKAALLGDVDGDGVADLVVLDPGSGQVFPGSSPGGVLTFTPGPRFAAAGTPTRLMRLAPGGASDFVTKMGDDLVIVQNAGGFSLR